VVVMPVMEPAVMAAVMEPVMAMVTMVEPMMAAMVEPMMAAVPHAVMAAAVPPTVSASAPRFRRHDVGESNNGGDDYYCYYQVLPIHFHISPMILSRYRAV
jgi:hypothetical protein